MSRVGPEIWDSSSWSHKEGKKRCVIEERRKDTNQTRFGWTKQRSAQYGWQRIVASRQRQIRPDNLTAACKTVGLLQKFSLEPELGDTRLGLVVVLVWCWIWIGRARRKSRSGHPLQPPLGCEPYRLEIRSEVHPGVPNGGRMEQIHCWIVRILSRLTVFHVAGSWQSALHDNVWFPTYRIAHTIFILDPNPNYPMLLLLCTVVPLVFRVLTRKCVTYLHLQFWIQILCLVAASSSTPLTVFIGTCEEENVIVNTVEFLILDGNINAKYFLLPCVRKCELLWRDRRQVDMYGSHKAESKSSDLDPSPRI